MLAGEGLRHYGNPELIQLAISEWAKDIESGLAHRGRYCRVRDAITMTARCSHDAAEDAIRDGRAYNADFFARELKFRVVEMCDQLQRIADANEIENPTAAVTALKTVAQLAGLDAPIKVDVQHTGGPSPQDQLRSMLECLDDRDRSDLERILGNLEIARAAGKLALALPDGRAVEEGLPS